MRSPTGRILTPGFWLLLALISGGDYDKGVAGHGPETARRLYDAHGQKLDEILSAGQFVLNKTIAWSKQLPAKLKQSSARWSGDLALKLAGGFPQDVLHYYLSPEQHSESDLQTLINEGTWGKQMDVVQLRQLTETYFDWKGRAYARKFASILCPPLLGQCFMLPNDASAQQLLTSCSFRVDKRPRRKDNAAMMNITYHPERLLGLSLSTEPELSDYKPDKFKNSSRLSRSRAPCRNGLSSMTCHMTMRSGVIAAH